MFFVIDNYSMTAKSKNELLKKSLPGESTTPGAVSCVKLGTSKPDPGGVLYMTYAEQLKSPKWQKKRLEILERDFFTCRSCHSKENTLHVHHLFYLSNINVWEYPNEFYVSLCEDCHKEIHQQTELLYRAIAKNNDDIGGDGVVDYIKSLRLAVLISWEQMLANSNFIDQDQSSLY